MQSTGIRLPRWKNITYPIDPKSDMADANHSATNRQCIRILPGRRTAHVAANTIPAMPVHITTGSILNMASAAVTKPPLSRPICHMIPFAQLLNWPMDAAYAGQAAGIRITGTSHSTACRLGRAEQIRIKTGGITANAGIFVRMASPRQMPDRVTNITCLPESLAYRAKRTEERMSGSRIESNRTILNIQDIGMTANMEDAMAAVLHPNIFFAIL